MYFIKFFPPAVILKEASSAKPTFVVTFEDCLFTTKVLSNFVNINYKPFDASGWQPQPPDCSARHDHAPQKHR
jgi:hypothetical protein